MIDNPSFSTRENALTASPVTTTARKKSRSTFVLPLQSVRALAALVVAAFHSIQFLEFSNTQIDAGNILNGRSAVFVFFIISGFVLGLTLETRPRTWKTCRGFIWRRFTRLFPAILFSSCVYALYYVVLYRPHAYSPETPYQLSPHQSSWRELFLNILLLSHSLNNVMWSLQVEALFSVLLPFIYWMAGDSWKANGLVFVLLLSLYYIYPLSVTGNPVASSHYLFFCFAGYLLVVLETPVLAAISRLSRPVICLLTGLALTVCAATPSLGSHYELFALAAVFLIAVIVSKRISFLFGILDWKPLVWLGTASYSFYLFHPLFLWSCVSIMWSILPAKLITGHPAAGTLLLFVCSVAVTIPFSFFSYYICERPFTSSYRKVNEAVSGAQPARAQAAT